MPPSAGQYFDRRNEEMYVKYIKLKMWTKDPHCKYCGIETVLASHVNLRPGEKTPAHIATIDHKYSRYNPDRDVLPQEYILCCALCNNYRAQLEEDKIPIEELRLRSQHTSYRTRTKTEEINS